MTAEDTLRTFNDGALMLLLRERNNAVSKLAHNRLGELLAENELLRQLARVERAIETAREHQE